MTDVALKVVEGRSVKASPILYVYGQKFMGTLFCADQAEADALKDSLAVGCYSKGIMLEQSSFEHKERTS